MKYGRNDDLRIGKTKYLSELVPYKLKLNEINYLYQCVGTAAALLPHTNVDDKDDYAYFIFNRNNEYSMEKQPIEPFRTFPNHKDTVEYIFPLYKKGVNHCMKSCLAMPVSAINFTDLHIGGPGFKYNERIYIKILSPIDWNDYNLNCTCYIELYVKKYIIDIQNQILEYQRLSYLVYLKMIIEKYNFSKCSYPYRTLQYLLRISNTIPSVLAQFSEYTNNMGWLDNPEQYGKFEMQLHFDPDPIDLNTCFYKLWTNDKWITKDKLNSRKESYNHILSFYDLNKNPLFTDEDMRFIDIRWSDETKKFSMTMDKLTKFTHRNHKLFDKLLKEYQE